VNVLARLAYGMNRNELLAFLNHGAKKAEETEPLPIDKKSL
jgi:hypothetical protein